MLKVAIVLDHARALPSPLQHKPHGAKDGGGNTEGIR